LSDNLEEKQNTHCCEDCGASFELVQEPQEILLEESKYTSKSQIILEWARENGHEVIELAMAEELKDGSK